MTYSIHATSVQPVDRIHPLSYQIAHELEEIYCFPAVDGASVHEHPTGLVDGDHVVVLVKQLHRVPFLTQAYPLSARRAIVLNVMSSWIMFQAEVSFIVCVVFLHRFLYDRNLNRNS